MTKAVRARKEAELAKLEGDQQKIEWVRLKQHYPDLYEQAKAYEKPNIVNGNTFYWNEDESLSDLERPERVTEIEENWAKTQARLARRQKNRTLAQTLGGLEVLPQNQQGCLLCHL